MFPVTKKFVGGQKEGLDINGELKWLQFDFTLDNVFDILSQRYNKRSGGYSRVLKAGFRTGDDAPMAVIELVDRNLEAKKVDKPKKIEKKEEKKEKAPKIAKK